MHHYICGDKHSPELILQFGSSAQKGLDLAASLVELLNISECCRCGHGRIGEAAHPGPAINGRLRDPQLLLGVSLVDAGTQRIQERVWLAFDQWLDESLSAQARQEVFLCPPLVVQLLRTYGTLLFQQGKHLYELRHLLVLMQQKFPLRNVMAPAWQLVSQWEELQPVKHRQPLPSIVFQAMFALAWLWKWKRFAGALLAGFEGIARIGEILAAKRADLVLPSDMFDRLCTKAFIKVCKPKSLRRGKGRVQHLTIDDPLTVAALENIFGGLDDFLPLFPLSASVFRNRWNRLTRALLILSSLRLTPASICGGGVIQCYKRGESIPNLMWKMRLCSQSTLESYVQELAAESFLVRLPDASKIRIRSLASLQCLSHSRK